MKTPTILTILLALAASTAADFGGGIGVGRDWTLSMDDTRGLGDRVLIDTVRITTDRIQLTVLPGEIPVFVQRSGFRPKVVALHAYLFADFPWVIDRIQLSSMFSAWEYTGAIWYPIDVQNDVTFNELASNPGNPDFYELARQPATLESQNMRFFGIDKTPFAKLHFDLSGIKSYTPPSFQNVHMQGGAGFSLHFSTPVLTNEFVSDAIENRVDGSTNLDSLEQQFSEQELTRYVLERIVERFQHPAFGLHFLAGVTIRPPSWPAGLFLRTKFMVSLSDVEPAIDLRGTGFLLTTGIEISL